MLGCHTIFQRRESFDLALYLFFLFCYLGNNRSHVLLFLDLYIIKVGTQMILKEYTLYNYKIDAYKYIV